MDDGRRCTFTKTGRNLAIQHIYRCRTCDPQDKLSVCQVCLTACHSGHDVFYDSCGRFFCECGEKGAPSCKRTSTSLCLAGPSVSTDDGRQCTYIKTGHNYVDQPWYVCHTCKLLTPLGTCRVCLDVCHSGHDVSKGDENIFFCDCGAKGAPFCKCLSPKPSSPGPSSTQTDEALEKLQCPVCLDTMSPPIYWCEHGHGMCFRCKESVSTCPQCREKMSGARNIELESLSRVLDHACEYCAEKVLLSELRNHKLVCRGLDHPCPLKPRCKWTGKLHYIQHHCRTAHAKDILKGRRNHFSVPMQGDTSKIRIIETLNRGMFLHHSAFNSKEGIFKATVKRINVTNDAKFLYTMTFYSPGIHDKIVFKKNVHAVTEDIEDIYRLCNGTTLHMNQTTNLLYTDFITYTLEIDHFQIKAYNSANLERIPQHQRNRFYKPKNNKKKTQYIDSEQPTMTKDTDAQ